MAQSPTITFVPMDQKPAGPVLGLFADSAGIPANVAVLIGEAPATRLAAAMKAEEFKGKGGSSLSLPAEPGFGNEATHVVLIGLDGDDDSPAPNAVRLGGQTFPKLPKGRNASLVLVGPKAPFTPEEAADFALGMKLAAYKFDLYFTKKKEDNGAPASILLHVADPVAARRAMKSREAVYNGVALARDLVNEPPNVLTPVEFASRAEKLEKLGVEIEILDEKAMKKLGMRALLGVGQGSEQESRLVIMKWMGAKSEKTQPIAFIGKGVVFDTGGISIKPAAGMEDMKGDMAGAAAVVGLMHTLAARKAKANVIGAIGLVENMPDGNAQRPGDIVKSMSGQTIEIINTDAEGRLVLADVLWHVKQKYNPGFMVNLATLTGAIMVALGQEYAGLFSNNDELAERLAKSGRATGEKLWRMPLGPEYDKQIDSKVADMKNTGGRFGGSITAAQFLQRYVDGCPWAHLDIAGTAMGSPQTDINKGWSSGFGVRLLDRLVADFYEG
ncbi:MAG: leucyl aminopeptidase [Beijerinckiaceae bacterium]|jgi:leucyl aminopeptidase|nr:leucyl aminopeptidase [Beijerinckiaceae bacterium]